MRPVDPPHRAFFVHSPPGAAYNAPAMCGRYVLPDEVALIAAWPLARGECLGPFQPRFNVAPTCSVPLLVRAPDGALGLRRARWGLIPEWWSKESPPSQTFNARSEEAADKPVWREALVRSRGLMPARGWFEWNENQPVPAPGGRMVHQPYFLCCPSADVVAFAALWSVWTRPGADPVVSCALLTTSAAPAIAAIHHRMPVVLPPDLHAAWLDPATPASRIPDLIAGVRQDLRGHPVALRVNSTRHDDPALLDPAPVHSMDSLGL
jgi:putative SOS response-associated peptidase YedK